MNIPESSLISIQRVSNGFILSLPSKLGGLPNLQPIFDQLKSYRNELEDDEDDVLTSIFSKAKNESEIENPTLQSDTGTYIFTRLKDLLAFLGDKFPDL